MTFGKKKYKINIWVLKKYKISIWVLNKYKISIWVLKKYKISIWVIFFENDNVLDLLPLFNPDINVVISFLHPNENTFYTKDLPSLPLLLQNRHDYYILNSFVIKVPTMYKPLN